MTTRDAQAFRAELDAFIGKPMGAGRSVAPDPVNVPMIRHWVDAIDDRNPVYLDEAAAAASSHGRLVAPPAMMQTWTFPRPLVQGIGERGGSPRESSGPSALTLLDEAGYTSTRATDSELEFERYLHPGDVLSAESALETVSDEKTTALGTGYFLTWLTTYRDQHGDVVGRQRFRVLKFRPHAKEA